jgi:hypothetical protein
VRSADHWTLISGRLATIFGRDGLRRDRRTGCKARRSCFLRGLRPGLLCQRRQDWHWGRNSNLLADRQFPRHFRGCTAILQSERTRRRCPVANNSPRGQRRFHRSGDHRGAQEFRAARLGWRGIRNPAGSPPGRHISRQRDVFGRGWLRLRESPHAIGCCVWPPWVWLLPSVGLSIRRDLFRP